MVPRTSRHALAGSETALAGRLGRRVEALAKTLDAFAERIASRRNGVLLVVAGLILAGVAFVAYPSYPNYDSYFSLVWGNDLAHGHLPHYQVFHSPTPHPLAVLVSTVVSQLGHSSDRILVALTFVSLVGLLAAAFRLAQLLFGTFIALLALGVLLTRTDLDLLTVRALVDIPFIALVLFAGVLEIEAPRRGWPVLAVLAVAGLMRPEAWPLSAAYVLWLAPAVPRRQLFWYAILAASGPVLWAISDWIIAGDPLYSLTSTRKATGALHRATGIGAALKRLPRALGGNQPFVNFAMGGVGALLGVHLLRRRAWIPAAIGGIGVIFYFGLALASLALNVRYLAATSILVSIGTAVALAGWIRMKPGRARKVALGIAIVTVGVFVWRGPRYHRDFHQLGQIVDYVNAQHSKLKSLIFQPVARASLKSCQPLTTPTHNAVPIIRLYVGLSRKAILAATRREDGQVAPPPRQGDQLIAKYFNTDRPPNLTSLNLPASRTEKPPAWASLPQPGFGIVPGGNSYWKLYSSCR